MMCFNQAAFRYYRRLDRVQCFVQENLRQPIRLADAARVAAMEKTAFSRFFRSKVGLTYSAWLAQVRITRAQELLRSKNLSISFVAGEVGYESVRSFERAFRRVAGMTPSAYRKRYRPC